MAKANSVHSTPPTNASPLSEVAEGLSELETPMLRIRSLALAARLMAGSSEMSDDPGLALDALASAIIDEIERVKDERTRLLHLARQCEEGSHAEG